MIPLLQHLRSFAPFRGFNSLIQLPSTYALDYILTPSGLSEKARLGAAGNVQLPFLGL